MLRDEGAAGGSMLHARYWCHGDKMHSHRAVHSHELQKIRLWGLRCPVQERVHCLLMT